VATTATQPKQQLAADASCSLFQLRAPNSLAMTMSLFEVDAVAGSLASHSCFVLQPAARNADTASVYVWYGRHSFVSERDAALRFGGVLSASAGKPSSSALVVKEGHEDDAFWSLLGGKAPYPTEPRPHVPLLSPRLFALVPEGASDDDDDGTRAAARLSALGHHADGAKVTLATLGLQMKELHFFAADDLLWDGAFLLDSGSDVCAWVGPTNALSLAAAGTHPLRIARAYVLGAEDGRPEGTA
jgi:hypothetical protein